MVYQNIIILYLKQETGIIKYYNTENGALSFNDY